VLVVVVRGTWLHYVVFGQERYMWTRDICGVMIYMDYGGRTYELLGNWCITHNLFLVHTFATMVVVAEL
jgi:hypothetical protein